MELASNNIYIESLPTLSKINNNNNKSFFKRIPSHVFECRRYFI